MSPSLSPLSYGPNNDLHRQDSAPNTGSPPPECSQKRQAERQADTPTLKDVRNTIDACTELPTHIKNALQALLSTVVSSDSSHVTDQTSSRSSEDTDCPKIVAQTGRKRI